MEGTTEEEGSRSDSPPCAPCLDELEADAEIEEAIEIPPLEEAIEVKVEKDAVDKDAESAADWPPCTPAATRRGSDGEGPLSDTERERVSSVERVALQSFPRGGAV